MTQFNAQSLFPWISENNSARKDTRTRDLNNYFGVYDYRPFASWERRGGGGIVSGWKGVCWSLLDADDPVSYIFIPHRHRIAISTSDKAVLSTLIPSCHCVVAPLIILTRSLFTHFSSSLFLFFPFLLQPFKKVSPRVDRYVNRAGTIRITGSSPRSVAVTHFEKLRVHGLFVCPLR